jgi:hypothetical protein
MDENNDVPAAAPCVRGLSCSAISRFCADGMTACTANTNIRMGSARIGAKSGTREHSLYIRMALVGIRTNRMVARMASARDSTTLSPLKNPTTDLNTENGGALEADTGGESAVAVHLLGVGDVACKHTRRGSVGIDATLDPQSWQI